METNRVKGARKVYHPMTTRRKVLTAWISRRSGWGPSDENAGIEVLVAPGRPQLGSVAGTNEWRTAWVDGSSDTLRFSRHAGQSIFRPSGAGLRVRPMGV